MATVSKRKQIRAAVKTLLTGISGVGSNVFANRAKKLFPEELPAIIIFAKDEPAEKFAESPREMKRTLRLVVEITKRIEEKSPSDTTPDDAFDAKLDDELDDICEEVEQRMFNNTTLNNLASDVLLNNTEIDHGIDGDREIAVAKITFDVEYYTYAPAETSGLDDFEKAHMEWTVEGGNNPAPAVDEVELPTE